MPALSEAQAGPSLPKLLSLESTYETFDDRLNAASVIANVSGKASSEKPTLRATQLARGEWVLRWLLERLGSDDPQGSEARAKQETFDVITRLVEDLPISVSARILKSRKFLAILERTLEGANARGDGAVQSSRNSLHADSTENATTDTHDVPVGKKRKSANTPARPSKRARSSDSADAAKLHDALTNLLQTIIDRVEADRASNPVSSEYLSSVFQTDVSQAARLLGLWLSFGRQLLRTSSTAVSLGPILRIWKSRVVTSAEDGRVESEFSLHCVLPASQLLSCVQSTQMADSDSPLQEGLSDIEHHMEQLLKKHVVIPAFQAFETDSSGRKADTKEAPYLRASLRPLTEYFEVASKGDKISKEEHAYQLVTSIFYIAARATPLSTPQQRLKHIPWLRAVFTELAYCCGADLSQPPPQLTSVSADALEQLLRASKLEGVDLPPEELLSAFALFSNVSNESAEVRWSLIAATLRFNPTFLFYTGSGPGASKPTNLSHQALRASIFKRLASITVGDGPLAGNVFIPSSHGNPVGVVDEIIAPLASAYVSVRQATDFVLDWAQQLSESWQSQNADGYASNIWQIEPVCKTVGLTIVSSLTVGEVVSLFENQLSKLRENLRLWHDDASQGAGAFSGLVVIHGLLRGVQSDAVTDAIKAQLDELHGMLLKRKSKDLDRTPDVWRQIFRLLSGVQDIASSSLEPSEMRQRLETFWDSKLLNSILPCLQSANSKGRKLFVEPALPETVRLLAQFSAASCAIPEFADRSTVAAKEATTAVCKVFDKYGSGGVKNKARGNKITLAMLAVLLLYPDVLSIIPSEARTTLFKSLIKQVSSEDGPAGYGSSDEHPSEYQAILSVLAERLCATGPVHARDELLDAVLEDLENGAGSNESDRNGISNTARSIYVRLPPRTIPRRHREAMIESLLKKLIGKAELDKQSVNIILSILVRFMAVPNPTSRLLRDLKAWKSLAKRLKGEGLSDDPLMSSFFRELFQLTTAQTSYLKEDVRDAFVAELAKTYQKYGQPKRKESRASDDTSHGIDLTAFGSAQKLCELLLSKDNARAHHDALHVARKQFAELDAAELSSLVSQLPEILEEDLLASEAVHVLDIVAEKFAERKVEVEGLKRLFLGACIRLGTTSDVRMFGRLSSFLVFSLKDRPILMSQWSSECLIASLANVTTGRSGTFSPEHCRGIFRHLCALGLALISFHRKRLRGRLHLLIPLLQSLLSWLFIVGPRTGPYVNRPSWLPNGPQHLDASDAAIYSRLLTVLCSPTVSSVQRHHKKPRDAHEALLVDETKRAKQYAGQYVHHIIMQFARNTIDSRLDAAVRDALLPGLFATIDIIPPGTLRAMNDEMDSAGRAIWHSLYDEWRTSGGRAKLDKAE